MMMMLQTMTSPHPGGNVHFLMTIGVRLICFVIFGRHEDIHIYSIFFIQEPFPNRVSGRKTTSMTIKPVKTNYNQTAHRSLKRFINSVSVALRSGLFTKTVTSDVNQSKLVFSPPTALG
jgi:hypothetical protein